MCVVKCFFDTTKYKVELEFGSLRSWRYCQGAAVHGNNRTGCDNSPGWLPGRLWAGGCTVKASISWLLGEAFRMTNGMRRGWNIHTHTSFKFTSCVLPSLPVSLPWLGPPVPSPCIYVCSLGAIHLFWASHILRCCCTYRVRLIRLRIKYIFQFRPLKTAVHLGGGVS